LGKVLYYSAQSAEYCLLIWCWSQERVMDMLVRGRHEVSNFAKQSASLFPSISV
jgi:hypothetical protein